ncbi:MAG: AI-2E family transporter [Lachnospiraceae bacterium]|nr:AI-2E family transporter [Lachnospiraceae bacterium]
MKFEDLKNKKWYNGVVIACSAVVLYVLLTNIVSVWNVIVHILGYFAPLILGCVLAYLVNPLAKWFEARIFKKVKKENIRWSVSVVIAFVTVILFLTFLLGTVIPQLVDSIKTFSGNFDGYVAAFQDLIDRWQLSKYVDVKKLMSSSENMWKTIVVYISDNIDNIVETSADVGKTLVNWVLGLVLSIYLLMAKTSVRQGVARFLKAVFSKKRYTSIKTFIVRCDDILSHYIVYSLIEGILIGVINAIFMSVMGMQYVGMISVVIAVTNLIPTFGPIIGGLIGAFILLLVNPLHALIFIIFTLVLQTLDGYVIKPKLFGNSLGVSGLLILIAIIVGGKMFGVVGILLAIPFAAIIDFVYKDYLLSAMEKKKDVTDKEVPEKDKA